MKKPLRLTQQGIVFAIFVVLFGVFSIFLRGFLSTSNMLNLLQNVAVLGILGLAMAIVVIGRGIDLSLIAVLAVPSGLVLQLVQDGDTFWYALLLSALLTLAFGLINGWLIAYAEVPSLYATLASGLFLAGLGQAALFKLDVVQWSPALEGFQFLGQGNVLGVPMPIIVFAADVPGGRVLPAANAPRHLHLRPGRQSLRGARPRASRPGRWSSRNT